MARGIGDIVLDDGQQGLFDDMCRVLDTSDDDLALMAQTQDLVNALLKRSEDAGLRDQTLGEVSRFFLGIMKARDLSAEYRGRKLRMFAKATLKILIAKRPILATQVPPVEPGRRTTDLTRIGVPA